MNNIHNLINVPNLLICPWKCNKFYLNIQGVFPEKTFAQHHFFSDKLRMVFGVLQQEKSQKNEQSIL